MAATPETITMLLDGSYPQDIRVRKEAEALVAASFRVLVVCPRRAGVPSNEVVNGVEILRIGKNYTIARKGIYDIINSVFGWHPLFSREAAEVLRTYSVGYVHVHDLPLAMVGLNLSRSLNARSVLDLHENYAEGIRTWFAWKRNPLIRWKDALFFGYRRWTAIEKKMISKYDRVVAVVDEMKERMVALHGVNADKITVISNTEPRLLANVSDPGVKRALDLEAFHITYVGGFGPHRGLDTAILAMPKVIAKVPTAKLLLVGKGNADVTAHLHELINGLGMKEHVFDLGQVPFSQAMGYMTYSEVNIIPHHSNGHTNNTVPHKLFQIMTLARPLLVSSCRPLERIVKTCDAGLVFKASDSNDLAEQIIRMNADYDYYEEKAKNALAAMKRSGMTWEDDARSLVEMYRSDDV